MFLPRGEFFHSRACPLYFLFLSQHWSIGYDFLSLFIQNHIFFLRCFFPFSLWRCLLCLIYHKDTKKTLSRSYVTSSHILSFYPLFLHLSFFKTLLTVLCSHFQFNFQATVIWFPFYLLFSNWRGPIASTFSDWVIIFRFSQRIPTEPIEFYYTPELHSRPISNSFSSFPL